MEKRISWDEYFISIVKLIGKRATCPRKQVGAVIVKNSQIISTGYNGAPKGFEHCNDVGCMVIDNHCQRVVHAEMNALLQAGKEANGATLYCTCLPCAICFKLCIQAGIQRIVYIENYKKNEVEYWIENSKIEMIQWKA